MKKSFLAVFVCVLLLSPIGIYGKNISWAQSPSGALTGKVIKIKGFQSLYYIGSDNKRYVFPNEKTYYSWYNDFSGVSEVNQEDVSNVTLAGNVQYKPGALLLKIQTDPKVYAVSNNGVIRWVKTENIAKQLYGDKWNLLVDDVPDTFFANYIVGTPIETTDEYDPDDEEDSVITINDNIYIKASMIANKSVNNNLALCEKMQKNINRIQNRMLMRGIKITGIADSFMQQCIQGAATADNNKNNDDKNKKKDKEEKKLVICHIPPGNAGAKQTLTVSTSAAKAHLEHGDTLGKCVDTTDKIPPIISNISATSITSSSANIVWTTNELSASRVVFATKSLSGATTTTMAIDSALVTSHSISLTSLHMLTKYYYRVESIDANNNIAASSENSFTTTDSSVVVDTTPPVISSLGASQINPTSAYITWTTNEPATSVMDYASSPLASATTTQSIADNTLVSSHTLILANLAPSTTYYYRVKSMDANSNAAASTEKSFATTALDTMPPVITSIVTAPKTTSTTITWTTNEPATSKVSYATQSLATSTTTLNVIDSTLTASHTATLTNLNALTVYYFRLESKDASNNISTSTEAMFTTLAPDDITPPTISGIIATSTGPFSMSVSWTTDEPATSKIIYATQSLTTATSTLSIIDSSLAISHSLALNGLVASTQYFFKVESKDAKNNTTLSPEGTFTLP